MAKPRNIIAWRPGRVARNTAHAGAWQVARIVLQALTLLLLARTFGPDKYGILSGTVAVFVTAAQIVGIGTNASLMRHIAKGGTADRRLWASQWVYASTGVVVAIATAMAARWLFGEAMSLRALAMLAAAEMMVTPLIGPLASRYQGAERIGVASALMTIAPIARCLAVAMVFAVGSSSLDVYAAVYLAVLSLLVVATLWKLLPSPQRPTRGDIVDEVREGGRYAVSMVAVTANGEIDKAVMLRLAGDHATGQYAAASRLMQAALMPVNALVLSLAPRWFRHEGATGGALRQLAIAALAVAAYSSAAALACWLLAPFAPFLFGEAFRASVPILQLLSFAIVSGAFRQVTMTLVMTSDLQHSRNLIEIGCIAVSVALMLWWIPRHGALGAAMAVIAADVLAVGLGVGSLVSARRRLTRRDATAS